MAEYTPRQTRGMRRTAKLMANFEEAERRVREATGGPISQGIDPFAPGGMAVETE